MGVPWTLLYLSWIYSLLQSTWYVGLWFGAFTALLEGRDNRLLG